MLAAQLAFLLMAGPALGAEYLKAQCVPVAFKVAIDIGHYRAAPGATSATGVTEFDYNLALAHMVSAALHEAGFTSTFLIGEAGTPFKLEERTRLAGVGQAHLFLSLHHDSVQPRFMTDWTVNGRAERYSDRFHGYSLFISDLNFDRERSQDFALLLGEALLAEGMTPSLHHADPIPGEGKLLLDGRLGLYRYDNLVVLRTARMPAVLLESAIIVNRAEEQAIQKGDHSAKVAAAIVKAVSRFCSVEANVGRRSVLLPAQLAPPRARPRDQGSVRPLPTVIPPELSQRPGQTVPPRDLSAVRYKPVQAPSPGQPIERMVEPELAPAVAQHTPSPAPPPEPVETPKPAP
jgi:N-acetylmuramoyl-L-alanine amidase